MLSFIKGINNIISDLGIQKVIDFFSLDNTLFTFMGEGVSTLEASCTVVGLLCVFLAVRGKVANFWIGYLYNILLFVMFLQKHLYSSMLLQPISLAINLFGHYRWTHPKAGEENSKRLLKVTTYNNGQRTVVIAVVLIFMFLWGYVLSRVDVWFPTIFSRANLPFLDAFVVGMVLMAQYLSAQKKIDCWGAWLIANCSNIILCAMAGLRMMTLVYAAYIVLAIGGFFMWRAEMKKDKMATSQEKNN